MERDTKNIQALKNLGWNVLVVWTCETRNKEILEDILKRFMGYGEAT
jgi:DNA mismatch endonuclease (patch repair protein)